MQTLGDGPQTLGLVFASVGVGCFFGPIAFNYFTPPRSTPLALSPVPIADLTHVMPCEVTLAGDTTSKQRVAERPCSPVAVVHMMLHIV